MRVLTGAIRKVESAIAFRTEKALSYLKFEGRCKAVNANPILLQKKYAHVMELYAKENAISLEKALDVFYRSELYNS